MSGPLSLNAEHLWNNQEVFSLSVFVTGMAEVTASQPAVVKSPNTFDQVIASNRQTVLVNHFRPGVAHRRLTASRGEGMKYHRERTKPQSVTVENWLAMTCKRDSSATIIMPNDMPLPSQTALKIQPLKKNTCKERTSLQDLVGWSARRHACLCLCVSATILQTAAFLMNTLQFITPP